MVTVRVRHLHQIGARWYWIPSATARKLGFKSMPLGADLAAAATRAQELNAKLDKARQSGEPEGPADGSVAVLIERYKRSPRWSRLSDKTRRDYGNILARLQVKAGTVDVASITVRDVAEMYDKLRAKHGDTMAAAMMRVWRILMRFACQIGWREENPAREVEIHGTPSRERVWTDAEIAAFCAKATASMSLAVRLALEIGQRQGDVLRLRWSDWDGAAFHVTQAKTKAKVVVPVSPTMRAELEAMRRDAVQVIVSEATRLPYKLDHFRHEFARIRKLAELPSDLQFRDLRRTAATELGAAGATDDEIRAVTGHRSRGVVAVYVRPDDRMSKAAQEKRLRNKSLKQQSKSAGENATD